MASPLSTLGSPSSSPLTAKHAHGLPPSHQVGDTRNPWERPRHCPRKCDLAEPCRPSSRCGRIHVLGLFANSRPFGLSSLYPVGVRLAATVEEREPKIDRWGPHDESHHSLFRSHQGCRRRSTTSRGGGGGVSGGGGCGRSHTRGRLRSRFEGHQGESQVSHQRPVRGR